MSIDEADLYEPPRRGVRVEDCDFYTTMDIPGVGLVHGQWDLRGEEAEYLGGIDVAGNRVLEVGPASGFITVALEGAGATVVAVETHPDAPWDFVPQGNLDMARVIETRSQHMERLRRSWCLVHERFGLDAKVHYGHGETLPDSMGSFDTAILAAVLLHCRRPLDVLEAAATRAERVVVTDLLPAGIAGAPMMRLLPKRDNEVTDSWWAISPELIRQYLEVLGFDHFEITTHSHRLDGAAHEFFTVVARR